MGLINLCSFLALFILTTKLESLVDISLSQRIAKDTQFLHTDPEKVVYNLIRTHSIFTPEIYITMHTPGREAYSVPLTNNLVRVCL